MSSRGHGEPEPEIQSLLFLVVCELVAREVLQQPEALLTVFTLKGLLARVDARVFGEVALVVELLPALFTVIRFLPRVDQPVFLQAHGLGEGLSTLGAAVRFLRHLGICRHRGLGDVPARRFLLVRGPMRFQRRLVAVTLPAGVARVRLLARVAALVDQQVLQEPAALGAV